MFVRSLSLGVAAAALLVGGAQAADLIIPTTPQPIYESAGFSWDGLYAGVNLGGQFGDDVDAQFLLGGAVGVNFMVADPILLGAEIQGNYLFENDDFDDAGQFLALARLGAVVTDSVLVYAAAGAGVQFNDDDDASIYALGGGVEFAATDAVSVRAEILGLGTFDDGDDFFEGAQATVGVFYHF
ncbi:outer membrane protein [Devosia submarina]|uniref:outer membrane protein n=1 Tax=Devosia submarina TaxID=1173082 RepID=UPI0013002B91|nr:outer membrane beta-barrel protein [Devosia submarina]